MCGGFPREQTDQAVLEQKDHTNSACMSVLGDMEYTIERNWPSIKPSEVIGHQWNTEATAIGIFRRPPVRSLSLEDISQILARNDLLQNSM